MGPDNSIYVLVLSCKEGLLLQDVPPMSDTDYMSVRLYDCKIVRVSCRQYVSPVLLFTTFFSAILKSLFSLG